MISLIYWHNTPCYYGLFSAKIHFFILIASFRKLLTIVLFDEKNLSLQTQIDKRKTGYEKIRIDNNCLFYGIQLLCAKAKVYRRRRQAVLPHHAG
jgi:hypothetical protein